MSSNSKFIFSLNDRSEYISFNSKSKDQRDQFFSNFIDGPVVINYSTGKVLKYQTGEHAFQSAKFYLTGHCDYARNFVIINNNESIYKTPSEAKKAGKALRLNQTELDYWSNSCFRYIQYSICMYKINTIPGFKEYLISTKRKYLLHHEALGKWPIYGGVFLEKSPFSDQLLWLKGDNLLGKMWMEIRNSL